MKILNYYEYFNIFIVYLLLIIYNDIDTKYIQ